MKTAWVTTCWLDSPENFKKTQQWLKFYSSLKLNVEDIILLDNASQDINIQKLVMPYGRCIVERFNEHMPRNGIWDYPYLWRALYFFQELFKTYDKIIYMDNDFYLFSNKIFRYCRADHEWTSFWCDRHNFPETGCQIISKYCENYWKFVEGSLEDFIKRNNGNEMERRLPLKYVSKHFIGDRWSEYPDKIIPKEADFSAQTVEII